jgi:hypothetical protein
MVVGAIGAIVAIAAAGCDSGPSGPGVLVASVQGESLGGALIEVTGRGIQGFDGLGGTQIYDAAVPSVPDAHRVILIHPDGGELRFEIHVADVGADDPVITVVSAAGVDNVRVLTAGIEARIER